MSKTISMLRRRVRRLIRSDEGSVVVETAVITPVVLLILFGAVDVVRYLQVQSNVIRAVSTTADAIGRQNGITTSQVTAFLGHAADTIDPDVTSGTATITVASVHRDGDQAPEVAWRRNQNAGTDQYQGTCQQTGAEGEAAVLPTGFTVESDDTVIVAEACYTFIPAFLISRVVFNLDFVPLDIYARAIAAARFGALTILEP